MQYLFFSVPIGGKPSYAYKVKVKYNFLMNYFFLFLFNFVVLSVHSQSYNYEYYLDDAVKKSFIYDIAQNKSGELLIATSEGFVNF